MAGAAAEAAGGGDGTDGKDGDDGDDADERRNKEERIVTGFSAVSSLTLYEFVFRTTATTVPCAGAYSPPVTLTLSPTEKAGWAFLPGALPQPAKHRALISTKPKILFM
jgi:hypothetical protein